MKMTLTQQPCAVACLPLSGEWSLGAPTAAPVQSAAVSAAARVRHTGTNAFAFGVVLDGTADAVAPPPRGAPV